MSKLWKVHVTVELDAYAIVFAETEDEARDIARDEAYEITDNGDRHTSTSASTLGDTAALPYGWDEDDTPFGGDQTIAEIRAGEIQKLTPRQLDRHTIDMFKGQPA